MQVQANVSLKRINSFMSNENIEEYVELIEKEKSRNPENFENEEDLKGIAINCFEATFNWDKNQVWKKLFFSRFLQILLFIFRTI